jgi:hypothetical protein
MTKTFAASHTQARHAIADAAFTAVRNKMILPSEQTEIVKAAMLSLQMTGTATSAARRSSSPHARRTAFAPPPSAT